MNSETKTYRFTLKPLNRIFFGGEKSPFKEEYYQHSKMMPQQTTVLGLLRYEILRRAKVLSDKSNWKALIGESSFDANTEEQDFGLIKRLSPVSVFNNKRDLFLIRDTCCFKRYKTSIRCNWGENKEVSEGEYYYFSKKSGDKDQLFDSKDYSQFGEIFTDLTTDFKISCMCEKNADSLSPDLKSGIFYQKENVGITKNYQGISNDKAFYKIEYLYMAPDYAYSFFAELKEHENIDWKKSHIVHFGGDSCLFLMEAKEETFPVYQQEGNGMVLLSDSYVSDEIYQHCETAISNTILFRNLQTKNTDNSYHKRTILSNPDRAKVLLKKGSILMLKKGKRKDVEKLFKLPQFQKIGYNVYLLTNKYLTE